MVALEALFTVIEPVESTVEKDFTPVILVISAVVSPKDFTLRFSILVMVVPRSIDAVPAITLATVFVLFVEVVSTESIALPSVDHCKIT